MLLSWCVLIGHFVLVLTYAGSGVFTAFRYDDPQIQALLFAL